MATSTPSSSLGTSDIRQNRQSPLLTIPPEILSTIFYFSLKLSPVAGARAARRFDRVAGSFHRLGWIIVTHVCRYWRQVAIETPSLWAHFSFHLGEQWTSEMMRRAKQAPVDLTFNKSWYEADGPSLTELVIRYLRTNMSHIRNLTLLSLSPSEMNRALAACANQPALILQDLDLSPTHWPPSTHEDSVVSVPSNLFADQAPRLLFIAFDGNFKFDWASGVLPFTRLQTLELSLDEYKPAPLSSLPSYIHTRLPTYEQLFDMLAALPELDSLGLYDVLPALELYHGSQKFPRTLHLPKGLQFLSVHGGIHECVALLNSLEFSPTVCLGVRPRFHDEAMSDFSLVFPILQAHVSAYDTVHHKSCRKQLNISLEEGYPRIMLSYLDIDSNYPHAGYYLAFETMTPTAGGLTRQLDTLKAFTASLNMPNVVLLELNMLECINGPGDWRALFTPFIHVIRLSLQNWKPRDLDLALLEFSTTPHVVPSGGQPGDLVSSQHPTLSQRIYLFPCLSQLAFAKTDFLSDNLEGSELLQSLCDSLRTRISHDVHPRLDLVGFLDCSVLEEDVSIFEKVTDAIESRRPVARCVEFTDDEDDGDTGSASD